jgi:1-acyl-sn-glycerol-3-phosphate acyltransferase
LILACNHPNSFLDAAILADLFKKPVYSLTRGDAFKKPFYAKLLIRLKMLPVYRTSEGVENLNENYQTFTECKKIFKRNGVVLIFSEGKCINEWHLRPLKKGTARLAFSSWNENIPLEVLPVGFNYSSFRRFGKNLFLNFGEIISKNDFDQTASDGIKYQLFNQKLEQELNRIVFEIPKNDIALQKKLLEIRPNVFTKIILAIPAAVGFLTHAPLYIPLEAFTVRRTYNNDHHDSVLVALLLFFYPVYLIVITVILILLSKNFWFLSLILFLPLMAWSYVQLKQQLDK